MLFIIDIFGNRLLIIERLLTKIMAGFQTIFFQGYLPVLNRFTVNNLIQPKLFSNRKKHTQRGSLEIEIGPLDGKVFRENLIKFSYRSANV